MVPHTVITATSAVEDGKTWVTFAAAADEGAEETVTKELPDLTARLSPWVFELPEYRAANLRKRTTDLVQPKKEEPPAPPAEGVPVPGEPESEMPTENPPGDEPMPVPVPEDDGPH